MFFGGGVGEGRGEGNGVEERGASMGGFSGERWAWGMERKARLYPKKKPKKEETPKKEKGKR